MPDTPKSKDWNLIYRWGVMVLLTVNFLGLSTLAYAARSFVRDVAHEAVKEVTNPMEIRIDANANALAGLSSFANQGPRFTSIDARLLKNEAVGDAVRIASIQTEKLEKKIDNLSSQVNEIKVLIASLPQSK